MSRTDFTRGLPRLNTASGSPNAVFCLKQGVPSRLRLHLRRLGLFLVLLLPLAGTGCSTVLSDSWNPIINLPDPFITHLNGNYYLLATPFSGGITMWVNPRMEKLGNSPNMVWTQPQDGSLASQLTQLWSPTLWQLNGTWWIYFTATPDGTSQGHRIYALRSTTTSPLGPYTFAGKVDTGQTSIDPSVLTVAGVNYLMYSINTGTEQDIYLSVLQDPLTAQAGVRLIVPDQPWETGAGSTDHLPIVEGPTALYHNGQTFIVYSGSSTASPAYCLGLLTYSGSGNVQDPKNWTKTGPVFSQNPAEGVYGPGRGSFTLSPDGTENWILYQAKQSGEDTGDNRTIRAQQFVWNTDGSPNFGSPISLKQDLAPPSGEQ